MLFDMITLPLALCDYIVMLVCSYTFNNKSELKEGINNYSAGKYSNSKYRIVGSVTSMNSMFKHISFNGNISIWVNQS